MKVSKTLPFIFTLFLVLAATNLAVAQKNFQKEADRDFDNYRYFSALEKYKAAYAKTKKKEVRAYILFRQGECCRMINDTKGAENWYEKAIKANYTESIVYLYAANMKKINQKYDEAIPYFKKYKELVPSDPRGEDGTKSCTLAADWKNNPTRYRVENVAQLNTKALDFAPSYIDRKYKNLYFTSTRDGSTGGTDPNTGSIYSDVFEAKVDKLGKWSTPTPLSKPVNSESNEGASVLNKRGQTMIFTRCKVNKKEVMKCNLMTVNKKGNTWGDPEYLPWCSDTTSFTYGHPTLSDDEQTLFFASDMPGGYGGKDIWVSQFNKKEKKWGTPVNLGPSINTDGDEMYPFMHTDGTLYFSSNRHLGMGGLDIFKAEKMGDKYGNIQNLRYPINSSGDDFAIIFEGKIERGYFSSNREGGKGSDDIYSFILPPCLYSLEGVVTDCEDGKPIEGIVIKLTGSDGTYAELKTDKAGYYKFDISGNARYINPNTSYVIETSTGDVKTHIASSEKGKITTINLTETECNKVFKKDFCLKTALKPIALPDIVYAFDKADLLPQSKDSLNYLYQTLIDNPGIVIELQSHTDARGSDKYNDKLSQARAQSCVDYLITEKKIPAARLKAKGYGKRVPRKLPNKMRVSCERCNGEFFSFDSATVMTEAWINTLKKESEAKFEAAHTLNRRTTFKILNWDYVDPNAPARPKTDIKLKVSGEEGVEGEGIEVETGGEETPKEQPKDATVPATPPQTAPTTTTPADPKKPN